MKSIVYILYFLSFTLVAQVEITPVLQQQDSLNADVFVAKNNFENTYYLKNNALIKIKDKETFSYSNIQLGQITSVNTFNPLKINVFYANLNTVIILDNRLAEITKLDFNTSQPYKNISHITTGFDSTLWLFNQDFQYLELYDYKTQTTRYKTIPVASKVLDLTSNYNYCWLLTENFLYCYNYFGSVVYKLPNLGYSSIKAANENLVIKKDKSLIFYNSKTKQFLPINLPNMLISQFFVTNQILYIYTRKMLYQYQLKTD
ncbi:hypothetical protein [Olleya aquimaris]|uniref:Uncharacterized protein n=1 Tax=Olleya aquimaris TaxID=639310 RepID=A0A327RFZ0_9FLAO|nr:hypothetical protein [Olleya aquimaris]RAJ15158.1 hypothetical protein LY08_01510 [Olleya aquimaris]